MHWHRTDLPNGGLVYELVDEQDDSMRLPDALLGKVAFVGCKIGGKVKRGASAFPIHEEGPDGWGCVVTARHVIDQIRHRSDDNKVYLLVNKSGGGVVPFKSDVDDWIPHPDAGVDVAVLPECPPLAGLDLTSYPAHRILTDDLVRTHKIGIGDELTIPGLFSPRPGKNRALPIIRQGIVSAIADEREPVDTDFGPMRAYLAEVRSIGGLSGAPVFFLNHFLRVVFEDEDIPNPIEDAEGGWFLLGLMHGHFDGRLPLREFETELTREAINMGIGIVVPGQEIHDAIYSTEAQRVRAKKTDDQDAGKEGVGVADDLWTKDDDADTYVREDFMRDLTKVTKRDEPPEREDN